MKKDAPKISVFCCLSPLEAPGPGQVDMIEGVKLIPVPCAGKIDIRYLAKAFETGADGVAIVTCKEGECRYLEGNLRAIKRAEAMDDLMREAGLGTGRVDIIQHSDGGFEQVRRSLVDFSRRIASLKASRLEGKDDIQ